MCLLVITEIETLDFLDTYKSHGTSWLFGGNNQWRKLISYALDE